MRYTPFLSILFVCMSLYADLGWSNESYTYQAALSGVKTQTKWILDETPNKVEISGQNRGNEIKAEYSKTFDLLHFVEKEPNEQPFEVQREGSNLSVTNQSKVKVLNAGRAPWIQEFKFGFKPFLESEKKELSFVIVYKKDTTLHEMIATKETTEPVTIDDKTYETQKLKITLKGFKKRFWKAEAWFDLKTKLLVKYKSNEGPGTPYVEVTLLK